MNNLICTIITHRKTTSDTFTQLRNHKPTISKPTRMKNPHNYRTQSRQFFPSLTTFKSKTIQKQPDIGHHYIHKQYHTCANSNRNINKSNKKPHSNSFDNYFLSKSMDQIYNHIVTLFHRGNNNLKVRHYKTKLNKSNSNNQPVLIQQSPILKQMHVSPIVNTYSNSNKCSKNQKGLLMIKKHSDLKVTLPIQEENIIDDSGHHENKKIIKVYHTKIYDTVCIKNNKNNNQAVSSAFTRESGFNIISNNNNDNIMNEECIIEHDNHIV